jgi:predicted transposase/invertase (TIGR01784 family)
MKDIINHHDRFFKEMFASREVARSFLMHYLPEEISAIVNADSVQLSKDSYTDSRLKSQFSDLLYNVKLITGHDAHIYVLFEHKSYPDPWIAWYLLSCKVRIWRQDMRIRKNRKMLPILSVVVYHGAMEWKIGPNFQDLFEVPAPLKRFIPDFEYSLCNLQPPTDVPEKGTLQLRIALMLLKTIFRPDIQEHLPVIFRLIRELPKNQTGYEFLEAVLTYISSATDKVDEDCLSHLVEDAFTHTGGEVMPTLFEKWTKKGEEKGIKNTVRESVAEILEIRFGNNPPQILTWLNQVSDVPTLKGFLRRAATVESMTEFERFLETAVKNGINKGI